SYYSVNKVFWCFQPARIQGNFLYGVLIEEMRYSMLSYDGVKQKPEQFLACTSLTAEEFDVLLISFSQAWDAYVKKNYINSGGGKPKLTHIAVKLILILFFYNV